MVKIIARENGPYLVEVDGQVKAALCRCGHSSNKPFCDGAHKKVGFPGTVLRDRAIALLKPPH
jgi:CDGSH-type Zn-finger protein